MRVVSGADGVELRSHTGVDPDAGFGRVVAAVGDVDGDGMPDLGVAEPFADATQQDVGCLLVYSGSDGTLLHRIFGDLGGSGFGSGLASAGDVDGDGRADITVGIPADGVSAGAVVVLSLGPWENLGAGLPGVNGIPDLTGQTGSIETDVELTLSGARGASAATLVVGYSTYVDLQHGVLSPMPDLVVNGLVTTSQGEVQLTFEWPEEAASGDKVYYQFRVLDPEAPGGESRSHAISGLIP